MIIKAFNRMLIRAKELDMLRGLKVGVGKHTKEITHLLFADDTTLFCEPNEHDMPNLSVFF